MRDVLWLTCNDEIICNSCNLRTTQVREKPFSTATQLVLRQPCRFRRSDQVFQATMLGSPDLHVSGIFLFVISRKYWRVWRVTSYWMRVRVPIVVFFDWRAQVCGIDDHSAMIARSESISRLQAIQATR